ncbi:MAG: transposase family protein [Chloroflexi bacterium]|nr:transposase family protein [Chloroflexota bacterium]
MVTGGGVLAGGEGLADLEDDGESKLDLLGELLPFAKGVPSDDTRRRFFRAVELQAFAAACAAFVRPLLPEAAPRLVAIAGKTLRHSHDGTAKALHLVPRTRIPRKARVVSKSAAGMRQTIPRGGRKHMPGLT